MWKVSSISPFFPSFNIHRTPTKKDMLTQLRISEWGICYPLSRLIFKAIFRFQRVESESSNSKKLKTNKLQIFLKKKKQNCEGNGQVLWIIHSFPPRIRWQRDLQRIDRPRLSWSQLQQSFCWSHIKRTPSRQWRPLNRNWIRAFTNQATQWRKPSSVPRSVCTRTSQIQEMGLLLYYNQLLHDDVPRCRSRIRR